MSDLGSGPDGSHQFNFCNTVTHTKLDSDADASWALALSCHHKCSSFKAYFFLIQIMCSL